MNDRERLAPIQRQFRRQADAYVRLREVTDEKGLRALVALSGAGRDDRVLDVACGPGFLTAAFAAQCGSAMGVDATDTFVAHACATAEQRGLRNVAFVLGDAEQLPFPDGAFAVTACRAAFHHFPRPERVLAEMRRVTTRRGRLVIADMLTSEDPEKADRHNHIERLCDPTHQRALAESEFEHLFAAHGLRVVFKGHSRLDYSLPEWLSHGGPPPEREQQIVQLMQASMAADRAGLNVRMENGEIRFSHVGVGFLLENAAA